MSFFLTILMVWTWQITDYRLLHSSQHPLCIKSMTQKGLETLSTERFVLFLLFFSWFAVLFGSLRPLGADFLLVFFSFSWDFLWVLVNLLLWSIWLACCWQVRCSGNFLLVFSFGGCFFAFFFPSPFWENVSLSIFVLFVSLHPSKAVSS